MTLEAEPASGQGGGEQHQAEQLQATPPGDGSAVAMPGDADSAAQGLAQPANKVRCRGASFSVS